MAYDPYDLASKESRDFKVRITEKAAKLNAIAARNERDGVRPLNHLEQNALHTIYAIGEFCDLARECLQRRGRTIPRFNSRIGIMQWAAKSIFKDVVENLDQLSATKFAVNSSLMTLQCRPKSVGVPPPYSRIVGDDELADIHEAAWRGTCMFCEKSAQEARKCKLKKAFDLTMMLDPTDNKCCWWRAD